MHWIEILRARYALQLLVGYIVKKFQPKIPTYMSRRIFLSLLKKANFGHHKTEMSNTTFFGPIPVPILSPLTIQYQNQYQFSNTHEK